MNALCLHCMTANVKSSRTCREGHKQLSCSRPIYKSPIPEAASLATEATKPLGELAALLQQTVELHLMSAECPSVTDTRSGTPITEKPWGCQAGQACNSSQRCLNGALACRLKGHNTQLPLTSAQHLSAFVLGHILAAIATAKLTTLLTPPPRSMVMFQRTHPLRQQGLPSKPDTSQALVCSAGKGPCTALKRDTLSFQLAHACFIQHSSGLPKWLSKWSLRFRCMLGMAKDARHIMPPSDPPASGVIVRFSGRTPSQSHPAGGTLYCSQGNPPAKRLD